MMLPKNPQRNCSIHERKDDCKEWSLFVKFGGPEKGRLGQCR